MARPRLHPEIADGLIREGYVVVEDFLSRSQVDHLLEVFRALDCETHRGGWTASMYSADLEYRAAVHGAIKEAFAGRSAELLPGYRACICNFLVKDPKTDDSGVVQVHQDPTFVDETRYSTVGVWVPLMDTDATNGAIAVLPGSQHWNDGPRSFGGWSGYSPMFGTLLEHAQPLPMRAGSALVFSQKLFHGSRTNRSLATRVSVASLLVANEAPLLCYYANPAMPDKLEVFEVDDDFYVRYPYGTRPSGVPRIAVVDRTFDPIRPEQLAAVRRNEHVVRE